MKRIVVTLASILLLASLYAVHVNPVKGQARSDVDITFYADDSAAWTALLGGQTDFIQWALTKEQKEAAEANPDIQIVRVDENSMYEFDLNSNYSIITYPGMRSPTNALRVRQAIARLIDKDYIIANILEYFGVRIDQPMSANQEDIWGDPSVIGENYPYPYDPQAAADLLAAEGFADADANGWLNYPSGWPGIPERADTTVYPLVVCIRRDHADRLAAGLYLVNQLEVMLAGTSIEAGFKTIVAMGDPRGGLAIRVYGKRDYHVYTGGWSVGRYPTHLFSLFDSQFWYPFSPNYITGFDSDGTPMYEDVDAAVEDIWYNDSIESAKIASKQFCVLHATYCINIPLWSYSTYWAWRKGLVAVTNEDGYGPDNAYTFLNAHRVDGGPIRFAALGGPSQLNVLHSQWYFEYAFLDRVYTGALSFNPYDLGTDQPWVVQDWKVGTWDDVGTTKSMCTYYLRRDVGIVAPVTGAFVRYFDAHDFEFTVWYNYAFDNSWQWGNFWYAKYTRIVDVNSDGWNEFQVYFDDYDYWFYCEPTYPLLTEQELIDPLCGTKTETWSQMLMTPFTLNQSVVQVVSCTLDGAPLVENLDYRIDADYPTFIHSGFTSLRDLTGNVSITYWYADIPSTGFYLAGLPWQQTMYSLGTHYPVSMTADPPSVGDTIVLAKNPYFFMDTPLLGEIDWKWNWVGTANPRGGCYRIDIFDVVRATGAYCTRGDGIFDVKYFPGADIDPNDLAHIGIFDLVSITSNYGKTFGTPPHESQNQTSLFLTLLQIAARVECGRLCACTFK